MTPIKEGGDLSERLRPVDGDILRVTLEVKECLSRPVSLLRKARGSH
jgi:hypothetical protein